MRVCKYLNQRVRKKKKKEKKTNEEILSFITQFKIEFLLPFTCCRKVLGKKPVVVLLMIPTTCTKIYCSKLLIIILLKIDWFINRSYFSFFNVATLISLYVNQFLQLFLKCSHYLFLSVCF